MQKMKKTNFSKSAGFLEILDEYIIQMVLGTFS